MQNMSSKENFFIGVALSNSSNYDSSICVLDRNKKIILLDKFYYAQDIDYFFESSPYVKNSAVAFSVPYDNRMLEGKWRIHSKNYKALFDYYNRILDTGTYWVKSERIKKYFKRFEMKWKKENIVGLQIADLIAYPMTRYILNNEGVNYAYDVIKSNIYQKDGKLYGLKVFPIK